jgi:hypothetical protein
MNLIVEGVQRSLIPLSKEIAKFLDLYGSNRKKAYSEILEWCSKHHKSYNRLNPNKKFEDTSSLQMA